MNGGRRRDGWAIALARSCTSGSGGTGGASSGGCMADPMLDERFDVLGLALPIAGCLKPDFEILTLDFLTALT